MLISISELKEVYTDKNFSSMNDKRLERKLEAIEKAIREYTHEHFRNRFKSSVAICENGDIYCITDFYQIGDTIEITQSKLNDGLYVVTGKEVGYITVDRPILDSDYMVVSLVEYPADIVEGAIELLDYECNGKKKQWIASESISRHSVSYRQYDGNNTIFGYPAELFSFAKKYSRWLT